MFSVDFKLLRISHPIKHSDPFFQISLSLLNIQPPETTDDLITFQTKYSNFPDNSSLPLGKYWIKFQQKHILNVRFLTTGRLNVNVITRFTFDIVCFQQLASPCKTTWRNTYIPADNGQLFYMQTIQTILLK